MKCHQKGCDLPAAFKYTWPGKDEAGVCVTHAGQLSLVASAIDMHLQLLPIVDPLQATLDAASKVWQAGRAERQMTLGKLIALLESLPQDRKVTGLGHLDSYRGYYDDLAFDPSGCTRPVAELLTECRATMGRVFTGYKGGDFLMGEMTPLWVAGYSYCGPMLMGLTDTDPATPITEEEPS